MARNDFDLIDWGEDVFSKLPELPKSARDTLVIVIPWVCLLIGLLRIFRDGDATIKLVLAPGSYFLAGRFLIGSILMVVSGFMLLVAFAKLQNRLFEGWRMLFWAEVLSLISALLFPGPVINAIGVLIVFYLIYQVKSYYR